VSAICALCSNALQICASDENAATDASYATFGCNLRHWPRILERQMK